VLLRLGTEETDLVPTLRDSAIGTKDPLIAG
jgi:hypothetical protein